jgi:hypothetical protein
LGAWPEQQPVTTIQLKPPAFSRSHHRLAEATTVQLNFHRLVELSPSG